MLYPMNETASSNALDSWQRLQQHFYNLRQSEQLRTIWNPSNLFAAGHRSKSVEMLRNHFTPYTNNHPEMSSGTAGTLKLHLEKKSSSMLVKRMTTTNT